MRKILFTVWEIAEIFLVALIAVAAIKYFLIQPFIVNGASMEPTFTDGDYLLIDEVSYRFEQPERGDVVVFRSPQNKSIYYIKRIVGLPGEGVEVNDSTVTINGKVIGESYLPNGIRNDWSGHTSFKLSDSQYFVMGDNRLNSFDSRYWGPLEKKDIIGLVKVRLWPPADAKLFNSVQYPTATSTAN
jgi:signal peptidase I